MKRFSIFQEEKWLSWRQKSLKIHWIGNCWQLCLLEQIWSMYSRLSVQSGDLQWLRNLLGCLQWFSSHPRVMLVCLIGIPTDWTDSCDTIYITCLPILDSRGICIWITPGWCHLLLNQYLWRNEICNLFGICHLTAWDAPQVFSNSGISEPDIAMPNRGTCSEYLCFLYSLFFRLVFFFLTVTHFSVFPLLLTGGSS